MSVIVYALSDFQVPKRKQYFRGRRRIVISWHRFYDPETGRYISADPIGLAGGINLYAYVGGNPVNFIDPYGLMGTRPPDIVSPFANNLGEVLAVDCIINGCKQGNQKSYIDAWADCASAYNKFIASHPEITPKEWAKIIQVLGGQDALIDSCAKKCQKETKKCCKGK